MCISTIIFKMVLISYLCNYMFYYILCSGTSTSHVLLRRVFIHKLKQNNSIIMASVSTTTATRNYIFYTHIFRANQSIKKVVSVFTNPKLHYFIISFLLKTWIGILCTHFLLLQIFWIPWLPLQCTWKLHSQHPIMHNNAIQLHNILLINNVQSWALLSWYDF